MVTFIGYWKTAAISQPCSLASAENRLRTLKKSSHGIHIGTAAGAISHTNYCSMEDSDNGTCTIRCDAGGNTFQACDVAISIDNNTLSVSRDQFGKTPCYWTEHEGSIWFSSHLRPLIDIRSDASVDIAGLYSYASFSFVAAPLSPIEHIYSLAPGSTTTWTRPTNSLDKPGLPASESLHRTTTNDWAEASELVSHEAAAVDALRHQLQSAIEWAVSDLPTNNVAILLSGGIDSALTAAALVHAGLQVTAYTLDFDAFGKTEVPVAEEVSKHLKIPLIRVSAKPKDIHNALRATVDAMDSPFGDGVTVPLYLLCRAAAEDGHTVVFNGEGGDQLFGGWANKPIIASSVYGHAESQINESDFLQAYMRTFHRFHGSEREVFSSKVFAAARGINLSTLLADALSGEHTPSLLHRLRRANLMLKGAQSIQPRATNIAVAHGLKVRSLFCHPSLARWSFSLTPELLLNGACEKYILKRAIEDWLPESVVWREKRGMGVPLSEWCLGPLWGTVGQHLNPKRLRAGNTWEADIAVRLACGEVSAQFYGRRIGELTWLILMWELWTQRNLKTAQQPNYKMLWPPVGLWKLFRTEAIVS